jgi:copper chaperone CopZ
MNAMLQVYCPEIGRKGRAREIKRAVGKLRGVQFVEADMAHRRVTVHYDSARVGDSAILRLLGRVGYRPG